MSEPRLVEVRRNVLKHNDVIARALREQFRGGSFCCEPGLESGLGKDYVSGENAHAIAAALPGGGPGRGSRHRK